MVTRRRLLQTTLAGALLPLVKGRLAFAAGPGEERFVLVILRGAMDGLAAVPAYGDGNYAGKRGSLALPAPGAADGVLGLDSLFGLHPALKHFHALYQGGELLVAHAVATPYRSRSHFDGQKLLENGTTKPLGADTGWLNRALAALPGKPGDDEAIALAQAVPLVLYGKQPASSWAPSVFRALDPLTLARIEQMYQPDPFFSGQLRDALEVRKMAGNLDDKHMRDLGSPGSLGQLPTMVKAAASFLTDPGGPRIAVLQIGGWDTHANQGAADGYLAGHLRALDEGMQMLKDGLKEAWKKTAVIIVSEFGRTAAVNGTRGTDHGTGSAAFVLGGAVKGGRVLADWPGLATKDLYQGRDLQPTLDMRSLFKTVLNRHLGVPEGALEKSVFPDSKSAGILDGIV